MEIIGFGGAVVMGLILGFLGGGGSILTVPILVYLLDIDPVLATAYSLFVVGLTSLFGSLSHMKQGHIEFRTGLVFAIPSLAAVYFTRRWVIPAIPDELLTIRGLPATRTRTPRTGDSQG